MSQLSMGSSCALSSLSLSWINNREHLTHMRETTHTHTPSPTVLWHNIQRLLGKDIAFISMTAQRKKLFQIRGAVLKASNQASSTETERVSWCLKLMQFNLWYVGWILYQRAVNLAWTSGASKGAHAIRNHQTGHLAQCTSIVLVNVQPCVCVCVCVCVCSKSSYLQKVVLCESVWVSVYCGYS